MFVYATYEAGAVYGSASFHVTEELIANWLTTYPGDLRGPFAPVGIVVLIQQKAYKDIVTPRPPGHVQGGQQFTLHKLIPVGATVVTQVSCTSKEIRKERKWVDMGFRGTVDGELAYTGINTILVPM
jgi:hypothetical protein